MAKGFCTYTISSKEFVIDDEHPYVDPVTGEKITWWDMRVTMLLIPAASWAELKSYIIKTCKRTGQCDKEISSWERTIQTIDKKLIDRSFENIDIQKNMR